MKAFSTFAVVAIVTIFIFCVFKFFKHDPRESEAPAELSEAPPNSQKIAIPSEFNNKSAVEKKMGATTTASQGVPSNNVPDQEFAVSPNIAAKVRSGDQAGSVEKKTVEHLAASINKNPSDIQIISPASRFPGEKVIAGGSLDFIDCQAIIDLNMALAIRVDSSGYVTEVAPLIPGTTVPPITGNLNSCHIMGGPNEPFVTTRLPATQEE